MRVPDVFSELPVTPLAAAARHAVAAVDTDTLAFRVADALHAVGLLSCMEDANVLFGYRSGDKGQLAACQRDSSDDVNNNSSRCRGNASSNETSSRVNCQHGAGPTDCAASELGVFPHNDSLQWESAPPRVAASCVVEHRPGSEVQTPQGNPTANPVAAHRDKKLKQQRLQQQQQQDPSQISKHPQPQHPSAPTHPQEMLGHNQEQRFQQQRPPKQQQQEQPPLPPQLRQQPQPAHDNHNRQQHHHLPNKRPHADLPQGAPPAKVRHLEDSSRLWTLATIAAQHATQADGRDEAEDDLQQQQRDAAPAGICSTRKDQRLCQGAARREPWRGQPLLPMPQLETPAASGEVHFQFGLQMLRAKMKRIWSIPPSRGPRKIAPSTASSLASTANVTASSISPTAAAAASLPSAAAAAATPPATAAACKLGTTPDATNHPGTPVQRTRQNPQVLAQCFCDAVDKIGLRTSGSKILNVMQNDPRASDQPFSQQQVQRRLGNYWEWLKECAGLPSDAPMRWSGVEQLMVQTHKAFMQYLRYPELLPSAAVVIAAATVVYEAEARVRSGHTPALLPPSARQITVTTGCAPLGQSAPVVQAAAPVAPPPAAALAAPAVAAAAAPPTAAAPVVPPPTQPRASAGLPAATATATGGTTPPAAAVATAPTAGLPAAATRTSAAVPRMAAAGYRAVQGSPHDHLLQLRHQQQPQPQPARQLSCRQPKPQAQPQQQPRPQQQPQLHLQPQQPQSHQKTSPLEACQQASQLAFLFQWALMHMQR